MKSPETTKKAARGKAAKAAGRQSRTRSGDGEAVGGVQRAANLDSVAFEDHVRVAAQGIRSVLAQVLAAVGADPTQPRGMARRFGLDKTLAWKLSRIVTEDNVLELVDYLPGRAGLDIAIRSLEDAGAAAYSIAALRHALAEFERVVELHCGDRETLELMLGFMQRDDQERIEAHRKRAFQGNRAIWGVQARLQVCAQFIAPSAAKPSKLDIATVSGLVDLRRLRQDTVWPVARFRQFTDDGHLLPDQSIEAIDDGATKAHGLPLWREYCSTPLPTLRARPASGGIVNYELQPGLVGATGAATCIVGWFARARFDMHRDPKHPHVNDFGEHMVGVNTPVETMIFDFYVHRSMKHAMHPEMAIHSQLPTEPLYPEGGRDRGRLHISERVLDLGESPLHVVTPEMPEYSEMTAQTFDRLGWNAADFRGFRFRMRYPPMPTLAIFRYPLPDRP